MALVKVLDECDLQEEFSKMNRDYFSIEGYKAILDLFDECDCGKNTDLDVIAICCDFTESTPANIVDDYSNLDDIADCVDEDGNIDEMLLLDALNYHTIAIDLGNGNFLYQNF